MNDDISDGYREQQDALGRVQAPGILLIVIGVLNMGLALWMLVSTTVLLRSGDDAIQKAAKEQWTNMSAEQRQQMTGMGYTEERYIQLFRGIIDVIAIWSGVSALCALVSLIGGVQMIRLRSRGLAITGAVLAAIPGLSCLSCALIGIGMGIWAFVVLMNSDVAAGFARAAMPPPAFDEPRI